MIYQKIDEISNGEIDNALRISLTAMRRNAQLFSGTFAEQTAENGVYGESSQIQQLSGLWPGALWLAYGLTAEKCFRDGAENLISRFTEYASDMKNGSSYDIGFLFSPSCVAAWKYAKNMQGRDAALQAAEALASQYRRKGQFIQLSGKSGEPPCYCFSSESILALPLLFWARDEAARQEFRDIAKAHLSTVVLNGVTGDGVVFGKFFMNPADGRPVAGSSASEFTGQSVPAYKQAETMLGIALCYRYDRQGEYVQTFRRLFSFYTSRLPPDLVPYWDMNVLSGEDQERDTAAAAVTACALIQMSENYCAGVPDDETFLWRRTAKRIMKVLSDRYAVRDYAESNGLLYSGSVRNENQCTLRGDYFYLEALCRLRSPHFINCW